MPRFGHCFIALVDRSEDLSAVVETEATDEDQLLGAGEKARDHRRGVASGPEARLLFRFTPALSRGRGMTIRSASTGLSHGIAGEARGRQVGGLSGRRGLHEDSVLLACQRFGFQVSPSMIYRYK